jgi:hypothetical protein
MAVTTTTILAAGRTATSSSTVTVDAGVIATIGLATSSADSGDQDLPDKSFAVKMVSTGGDDVTIGVLDRQTRSFSVVGPADVKVFRPLLDTDEPEVLVYKKV